MIPTDLELIFASFQLLETTNPQWLDAIVNRPSGSQWGYILSNWTEIANLNWQRVPLSDRIDGLHRPECVYFHHVAEPGTVDARNLHPNATENIKLLSEFEGDFSSIYLDEGLHGLELRSKKVEPRSTREAWLIIGPPRGEQYPPRIVWTSYPGRLANSITGHPLWQGSLDCLEAVSNSKIPIAVKGIKY